VLCPNGQAKSVAAIGVMKSSLANEDAPGVPMRVAEPGNANTFGDSRERPQNDVQSFAVQNQAALPSAEIAKSTTFER